MPIINAWEKLFFFFYLHQLCEEIHGNGRASVEEHWRAGQEALWMNGKIQLSKQSKLAATRKNTSTGQSLCVDFIWRCTQSLPAMSAWSSSSMLRTQRNKQLIPWVQGTNIRKLNNGHMTAGHAMTGKGWEMVLNMKIDQRRESEARNQMHIYGNWREIS